jgi:hypothetical protein
VNQLGLFEQPAPEPVRRTGGAPRSVAAKLERAQTEEVRQAYLLVLYARPDEWLDYRAFHDVRERYDLTSCWSRPLHHLVHRGLIEERNVHHGAERPGPGYTGFHNEWRAIAPAT